MNILIRGSCKTSVSVWEGRALSRPRTGRSPSLPRFCNCYIQKIGKGLRLAAFVLAAFCARNASAEWLWWTLDFTDTWGNEGSLSTNPAGEGSFDVWLVAENSTGGWTSLSDRIPIVADWSQTISQVELGAFASNEYVFFVELGCSGTTDYHWLSQKVSYEDLVTAGYVTATLDPMLIPWNPAVGGTWSTPEPSGGLLTLIGLAALLLRRRRECS